MEQAEGVRRDLKSGALWSTINVFATRILLFGTTIVLARVLSPSDFGVVGLGMVVYSLAALFSDLGISASLIQAKEHIEEQANASFWLNLMIGGGLTLLTFIIAPWVGVFYKNPLVTPLLRVQGLAFLLNAVSTVQSVLLTKNMDFKHLARIDIVSGLGERSFALILAFTGFAAWSLVLPSIFLSPVRAILLWRASPFRPKWHLYRNQWSHIFNFGKHVFATSVLRYININGDYFIIGKVMGATPLGIYTFAYNLANWPIENIVWVVNRISFPAFSKLQDQTEELQRVYSRIIESVSLLAFPIMLGMLAVSDNMVTQVYGAKWQEGILPLKIIIGFMLVRTIASPGGGVLLARGKPKIEFHFNLIQMPLLVTAIVIGSHYGIVGVAIGMAAVLGSMGVVFIRIVQNQIHMSWRAFWTDVQPGLVSSTLMMIGIFLFRFATRPLLGDNLARLLIEVALGALLYGLALKLFYPRCLQQVFDLIKRKGRTDAGQ